MKLRVRLIDIQENIQVWGDNFKFHLEADDMFVFQENLAKKISLLIGGEYGHINRKVSKYLVNNKIENITEHLVLLKYY